MILVFCFFCLVHLESIFRWRLRLRIAPRCAPFPLALTSNKGESYPEPSFSKLPFDTGYFKSKFFLGFLPLLRPKGFTKLSSLTLTSNCKETPLNP